MATSELWTRENMAWMAGLFEGEGYIGWRRSAEKGPHLGLRLGMTDEDVVQRFADLSIVGKMYGPYRKFAPDGREIKTNWQFIASGKEAYALAVAMLQWLGVRRSEQVRSAIAKWLETPERIRHLTADQVRAIRVELAALDPNQKKSGPRGAGNGRGSGPPEGPTMASIGREYGVPTSSIRKIRDGDTYKYIT